MPAQDGLRFLFDITDKITAKLAKIEAKSKASAAKIDKAFTRASRSQEKNSARAVAAEQRRIAAVNKAHAQAIKLLKRESDAFKRSMTTLASSATVAFAAVAGKALSMAAGYDAAMRSVQAKTQASAEDMKLLTAQSREMGRTTVHSATEAARGQAFLAQAGFDVNEIMSALPATLALATAGELGLAEAADIASNVVSGFRLEVDQTGRVSDVLAKSAASANTSVAEMGAAMAKAAPSAASAGWSLEQTAAAIGVLADNAIKGEEGGTLLKTMLAKLAPTTGATAKKLNQLGIEVHTATGRVKPLDEILQALAPHTDNTGLMFELLGTRGANAGLILGSLAEGEFDQLTKALEDSEGAAQRMADTMSGGLWGALKKFQSIAESAFISFGERLTPAIVWGASVFADLPGPIQEVVVVVGSLVAAMGGLMIVMPQSFGAIVQFPGKLLKLGKALKSTAAMQRLLNLAMRMNPIGLVITAVALLAGGIYLLWKRYNKLQKTFDAAAASTEDLTARYDDLKEKISDVADKLKLARKEADDSLFIDHSIVSHEKRLRVLVAERDELEKHIQQRAETAKAAKKLADAEKKAAEKKEQAVKKLAAAQIEVSKATKKTSETLEELSRKWTEATLEGNEYLDMISQVADATPVATVEFKNMGTGLHEAAVIMSTEMYEAAKSLEEKQIELAKSAEALRLEEEALRIETEAGTQAASGYDLALAGLAGQMGGATGQALNLVIAMREHNKAQKAAAEAGRETEQEFSKIQVGAATLGLAFTAIGDAIGGTAGKVLSELGGIAQAFATGGIVGGIMAGIGSLVKGLASLFGRGKKKRQAAAKAEADAAKIVADAAAAAAETHAEAVETLRRAWLSIPTDQIVLDLTAIRDAWNALGLGHRTVAFYDYAKSLISARDAGAALTAVN